MSTVDVEKMLQSDDPRDWCKVWEAYTAHQLLADALRETEGSTIPQDIMKRGAALTLLDRMQGVPVVTALDGIRATRRIAELEMAGRWRPMMEARESGASWEQIADAAQVVPSRMATGDPGADTRAWYALRVAEEAGRGVLTGALRERAYAVLDTIAADTPPGNAAAAGEPAVEQPAEERQAHEPVADDDPPDSEGEA